jgi:hypothetical protein
MNKEKYNGYKNRSTWLVFLHLQNTSEEIYIRAVEIAVQSNTTRQFKNLIRPILLSIPQLWKEEDFDVLRVDFSQVWDNMRIV